jgi:hypothetical protein
LEPPNKRDTIDATSGGFTFVGYSSHSKAWRLLKQGATRVIESANVVFRENEYVSPVEMDGPPQEYQTLMLTDNPEEGPEDECESDEEPLQEEMEEEEVQDADVAEEEQSEDAPDERRFPLRNRQPSTRLYEGYVHLAGGATNEAPATFKEAMNGTDAELWEEAKNEELVALRAKGVYTECDLPLAKTLYPRKECLL